MKPKIRAIIAITVSLLFSVNTVYAMDMKADFKLDQQEQTEQPVEKKKTCHGESHGSSSASMDNYSYDCCGVDCQSCTSVSLYQAAKPVNSYDSSNLFVSVDTLESPLDAHASNLYRPPIVS